MSESNTDAFERVFELGYGPRASRRFFELTGGTAIPAAFVDRAQVRAAEQYVRQAAKALGIDPPTIRWFKSTELSGAQLGWFLPQMCKAIWIRADLGPGELERTCYHEVKHAADFKHGQSANERAAEEFAGSLIRRSDWHTPVRHLHRHLP